MSLLRRQLNTSITNNIETRDVNELKSKTGNTYESIAIIGKRANQINISLKEELHNKLDEFASHTDSLEEIHVRFKSTIIPPLFLQEQLQRRQCN